MVSIWDTLTYHILNMQPQLSGSRPFSFATKTIFLCLTLVLTSKRFDKISHTKKTCFFLSIMLNFFFLLLLRYIFGANWWNHLDSVQHVTDCWELISPFIALVRQQLPQPAPASCGKAVTRDPAWYNTWDVNIGQMWLL